MKEQLIHIGQQARHAARFLATCPSDQKKHALLSIARHLEQEQQAILAANATDLQTAKAAGMEKALLDRLTLNDDRISAMIKGVETIAAMEDPVGTLLAQWQRPNGLSIARVRVPLGVIGIIYEARPNVTADAAALCLQSGNAAILRCGSDSFYSSQAIANAISKALVEVHLDPAIIQLVPCKERQAVDVMLHMHQYIDVIIPRGGKGLCQKVQKESTIPTLLHLDGNCHSYVHNDADIDMAITVIVNAKMRRPGICGATESVVIDQELAPVFLPKLADALLAAGCQLRGDAQACAIDNRLFPAQDADWHTEYLDAILAIKILPDLAAAIDFINLHSSHHTDAIITNNQEAARIFLHHIDSAIVMHNASTQFADGGEFGMGAEIGISTGRLHARGPVGAAQLTTYKYVVEGQGQTRP